MRILLIILITSKYLFPVSGVITFNDGTKIEGDISNVSDKSISITPMGLTFPEEIRMENVDSLKFSDGSLLVANNKLLYLYVNGEFLKPGTSINNNDKTESQDYAVEYVLVPNWSANVYTGYPIIRASSFDEFDKNNIVFGLSIGTPYGIYAGDGTNELADFWWGNFHENSDSAATGQASWLETGGDARASLEATATCGVPELYNSGVIYDPSIPEFSKS